MKRITASPLVLALLCTANTVIAADNATAESTASQTAETQLPTVVVTDRREDLRDVLSPGVVSVVYPDDVKGEHKSLPDLLDQIPGVYVRRIAGTGQYTTASIRGSAPSQVNVYIDGIPVNLASETAADLSTIPISNVERVEVYRGTTPARFSGAPIGGAINIVTKKPSAVGGSVSVGERSFGGAQASASLTAPLARGSLLLGVDSERSTGDFKYKDYVTQSLNNLVYSDGVRYKTDQFLVSGGVVTNTHATYDGLSAGVYDYSVPPLGPFLGPNWRDVPVERTRQNNDWEKNNALLKWQDERFVAKLAYLDMKRFAPWSITSNGIGYSFHDQDLPWAYPSNHTPRRRQTIEQYDGLLGWNDSIGKLTLAANLTFLDKVANYANLDYPPNSNYIGQRWIDYHTKRYGVAGDATYQLGEGGALPQLFELHAERYQETLYSQISGNAPGSDFIPQFRRNIVNLQAQDNITVKALGDLQVTPILRVQKLDGPTIGSRWAPLGGPSGNYDWEPTGSLALKKNFAGGWQAYGSFGNYIRYPSFYEIYGNGIGTVPGADSTGKAAQLIPETGMNGDLGIGWDGLLTKDLRGGLRVTYFQREAKHAITAFPTPIATKYVNSGNTFTRGIEVESNLAWNERADLQFAATGQEGHYVSGGWYYFGGQTAQQRFPGEKVRTLNTPNLTANVRLNLHFLNGALTTYVEGKYTGRNYIDVATWENPLTTIDLGAHWKVAKDWKLSFGVADLFNRGPQQTLGSTSYASKDHRITNECPGDTFLLGGGDPASGLSDCLFGFLDYVTTHDVHSIKQNVMYPQQGRTSYVTLTWTF